MRDRGDLWSGLALAVGLVLWHLPALTLTPGVNHDEIMLTAPARSWTATGTIALPQLADVNETYRTGYYWHPPGFVVLMAAAFRIFGFAIEVTRGISVISAACAAALFFRVLRRCEIDRPLAAATTALLACHPLFWWLCRSGRMDLIALCGGLAAMLVALRPGGNGYVRALLMGLLLGLGSMFHVMILAWAPALVIANAARERRLRFGSAAIVLLTAVVPLAGWVAGAYSSGQGAAWYEQFVRYQLMQRSAQVAWWRQPAGELWLIATQFRYLPAVMIVVAAGLGLGWRGAVNGARRWALGGFAVAFLLIAFATAKGTGAYPLYWFIWALLVGAAGLAALGPRMRRTLVFLALANAAAFQGATAAIALYQRAARDPSRVDRFFAAHLKTGAVVAGPEDIGYAVEHAGCSLRIWVKPDPTRHDYAVTHANVAAVAPSGFTLEAELPDIMPQIAGHYFSHTSCSYRLWAALPRRTSVPAVDQ